MNDINSVKFQIFVDGTQAGSVGRWKHIPLMVASSWAIGSDGEKFEVLTAIRKTYNRENESVICKNENRTPSQVGRSEGFTELKYRRAISSALEVEIVKPITPYRHMTPQSTFKLIDWSRRES